MRIRSSRAWTVALIVAGACGESTDPFSVALTPTFAVARFSDMTYALPSNWSNGGPRFVPPNPSDCSYSSSSGAFKCAPIPVTAQMVGWQCLGADCGTIRYSYILYDESGQAVSTAIRATRIQLTSDIDRGFLAGVGAGGDIVVMKYHGVLTIDGVGGPELSMSGTSTQLDSTTSRDGGRTPEVQQITSTTSVVRVAIGESCPRSGTITAHGTTRPSSFIREQQAASYDWTAGLVFAGGVANYSRAAPGDTFSASPPTCG